MIDAIVLLPALLASFAIGALLVAVAAWQIIKGTAVESFTDGFVEALNEVGAMQQYAYREMVGQPHSEAILTTLDSVHAGLANTLAALKKADEA